MLLDTDSNTYHSPAGANRATYPSAALRAGSAALLLVCCFGGGFFGSLYIHRQVEDEGGAFGELAFEGDGGGQQVGELFADGQAQPGAFAAAGDGAVELAELFEDLLLFGRADARAGIGDADADGGVVGLLSADLDAAAFGGELDGIAQEVVQDLLDLLRIGIDQRQAVGDVQAHLDHLLLGQRRKERHQPLQQVRDTGLLDAQLHLAGLGFGQVQQVINHVQQIAP